MRIKLQEPWHIAYKWFSWSLQDEGFGVPDYAIEGRGDLELEYNGDLYTKPKKEIRQALKKKWVYQAKSVQLVITPSRSWRKIGSLKELEEQRKEALLRYSIQ